MKAISLWQPWASLWCSGVKVHETRHWPTAHRGWLAVHAAKRRIDDFSGDRLDDICDSVWGHHWGLELPRGAIVGIVHLVDCVPTRSGLKCAARDEDDFDCGDFSEGRFAWRADNFKEFVDAIPYRGQQGMFSVSDKILPAIKPTDEDGSNG